MKPVDRVYTWLAARAEQGLRMLQDREIARELGIRSGKRVEHAITRLRLQRRILVHLTGAGSTIQRKVQIAATGYCTAWSERPPAPREPIPKAVVLAPARPPSFHELMAGRKYDDIRLRNAP